LPLDINRKTQNKAKKMEHENNFCVVKFSEKISYEKSFSVFFYNIIRTGKSVVNEKSESIFQLETFAVSCFSCCPLLLLPSLLSRIYMRVIFTMKMTET
jgi:hypothetical protein